MILAQLKIDAIVNAVEVVRSAIADRRYRDVWQKDI